MGFLVRCVLGFRIARAEDLRLAKLLKTAIRGRQPIRRGRASQPDQRITRQKDPRFEVFQLKQVLRLRTLHPNNRPSTNQQ